MPVTASDFLVAAQASCAVGDEISYRNCVSRAYYSVYHAALPVAVAHCPDPNANSWIGEHARLSERYRASSLPKAKSIGYVLEDMKKARHRADYHLQQTVAASDAKQALANAKAFAGYLAALEQAVQAASSGSGQSDSASSQTGKT
ncbi:hypothetical protein [Ralstonia pseudosolanacearum]|uniref:hypothetical protein n=1 Tax=Ralstonia pseudosolanacearum TaxID=1310165 RepID=UPI003CF12C9E